MHAYSINTVSYAYHMLLKCINIIIDISTLQKDVTRHFTADGNTERQTNRDHEGERGIYSSDSSQIMHFFLFSTKKSMPHFLSQPIKTSLFQFEVPGRQFH